VTVGLARPPRSAWDVVIVGAGPAGSALACRLRPRHRVLLLERPPAAGAMGATAPGTARIGESLPGAAGVLLQRLGLFGLFLAQGHAERGVSVSQWATDAPTWFDAVRDPQGPGWHLDRRRFDAGLRAAAVAAGAELHDSSRRLQVRHDGDGWRIELEGPGPSRRVHHAAVLVDASGRRAMAARQLGLARRAEDPLICLYAHLPADPGDEDRATRICADSNGWWYSVRVPSGQRVLAFHLDRDDSELKALRDPAQLLAKARRQALLAGIEWGSAAVRVHAQPAGGAGLDPDALAALPDGFYAVGDAMQAFDPLASQGLFHALATAESVARAVERQADGLKQARHRYLDEMRAVQSHHRQRLAETYAAVTRFAGETFWRRRIDRVGRDRMEMQLTS
jgi:flavin-dependent dehydrogenase